MKKKIFFSIFTFESKFVIQIIFPLINIIIIIYLRITIECSECASTELHHKHNISPQTMTTQLSTPNIIILN